MACLPRLRGVPILDSNPVVMTQYERWRSEIRKSLEANIGDGVKRAVRQHGYESYDCQIVVNFRSPRLAAIFNCGWAELE